MIFFCVLLCVCCAGNQESTAQLEWEEGRAIALLWKGPSQPVVYLAGNRSQEVLGRWEVLPQGDRFTPLAGFSAGLTYYLVETDGDSTALEIPSPEARKPARVIAVYPTTDSLPSNLLKMYLQFSDPMQYAGHPLDHLRVRDLTSDTVVQPFLRLETGLWNVEQTQLTLWLDPGRIKTGLIPNKELGIPLEPGHRYRMELDAGLRSADGRELEPVLLKEWVVGPADRGMPDPTLWEMRLPTSGSTEPLVLLFRESLDAQLLRESLRLAGPGGAWIRGEWDPGPNESSISFTPSTNWLKGEYVIHIDLLLEDLAGNNLVRLFDSDLQHDSRSAAGNAGILSFSLP